MADPYDPKSSTLPARGCRDVYATIDTAYDPPKLLYWVFQDEVAVNAGRDRLAITPEMVEAGSARLSEMLRAGVGSAYVVEEVYRAMGMKPKKKRHD